MKILWIKSDFLYPPDTGGKIRSYNILRKLAGLHEVSYLCLSEEEPSQEGLAHLKSFCRDVEYYRFNPDIKFSPQFYLTLLKNMFSPHPYVINKYKNDKILERIKARILQREIDIILCDFLEMAFNCMHIDGIPKVLFQHNVETEIWRRHFEVNDNPLKKGYLYLEYQKFYKFEKAACAKFDDAQKQFSGILQKLLDLAEIEGGIRSLAVEIEKTKRRVNVLENNLIPRLYATRKYIEMQLEELEREDFFRRKRIKALMEAKKLEEGL